MISLRFNSSTCISRPSHSVQGRRVINSKHVNGQRVIKPHAKVVVLKKTITGQEVYEEIEVEEDPNPYENNYLMLLICVVTLMHIIISH